MVKLPNPGRTRLFKISVPTASALTRQTLALSRAACRWPRCKEVFVVIIEYI